MADFENIRFERAGDLATITLNKPERLNACAPAMAEELFVAIRDLGDARALLIKGEGRAFCSGADLSARGEGRTATTAGDGSFTALQQSYNPLMASLWNLPIPVVTAVNGPAAGIGCSIALAGDFVLAGKSGYFLQAFVNIGLVPDGGSSWILPRLAGLAQATRMMMLGERIHGEEAERIGLIYKCVEDEVLAKEAQALAERLAAGPTVALGQMKKNVRGALQSELSTALMMEAQGQRIAGSSEDAAEGGKSFLEKRKPAFKGR